MDYNSKIYIAGHNGMVGSAIHRKLVSNGYKNIVFQNSNELNLINQSQVNDYFKRESPEYVIIAAAKVGGILANNQFRAEFIYNNLMIQTNIIHAAQKYMVKKLLFLGSSCIYPKLCTQPIKEDYLLSGSLENTNEPYALAKIAGIKMCESYFKQYGCNFISVMPTNLYGINDNFDLETSHVLPALIRKLYEAKILNKKNVTIWGSGNPKREFLYVDDLAEACIFVMNEINANELYEDLNISHLNVGTGIDISISKLAKIISKVIGYNGNLTYDTSKPDGTPRKLLNVSKINQLGWYYKTDLEEGIKITYKWYKDKYAKIFKNNIS